MIVESLLLQLMYEVPSDPTIREITITKECITDGEKPQVKRLA